MENSNTLPNKERVYTELEMIDFAWFMYKKLGKFNDDEQAHRNGKYLNLWKEQQINRTIESLNK